MQSNELKRVSIVTCVLDENVYAACRASLERAAELLSRAMSKSRSSPSTIRPTQSRHRGRSEEGRAKASGELIVFCHEGMSSFRATGLLDCRRRWSVWQAADRSGACSALWDEAARRFSVMLKTEQGTRRILVHCRLRSTPSTNSALASRRPCRCALTSGLADHHPLRRRPLSTSARSRVRVLRCRLCRAGITRRHGIDLLPTIASNVSCNESGCSNGAKWGGRWGRRVGEYGLGCSRGGF